MKHIKPMLATIIALIALAALASTATAVEFEIRPGGEATSVSLGLVTFEEGEGIVRIACRITLLIRLNTGPIPKVVGNQFGLVERVTTGDENGRTERCNNRERARILERGGTSANPATVNWPITYNSILGTLPSNVTGILFIVNRTAFLLEVNTIFGAITCLFEGNVGARMEVTPIGGNAYTSGLIRILEAERIPRHTAALNSGFCPAEGRMIGRFELRPAQTITRT